MPKRKQTRIGPRDIELLQALDRCPLTVAQLLRISNTFASPFRDIGNLRRRMRALHDAGFVNWWRYAVASEGQSPKYFKLSRDGYRLLYGMDVAIPRRRYFEEIKPGHHHHTFCLAEFLVHLIDVGHRHGIEIREFAHENSFKLEAGGFTLYPDCGFQLLTQDGRSFNFMVELDNGTERIHTRLDVESIERKLRAYDAHQRQFAASDPRRYLVLFVTTRSQIRLQNIMRQADVVMINRQRTVFIGCDFKSLLEADPVSDSVYSDHRGLRRSLIPLKETMRSG